MPTLMTTSSIKNFVLNISDVPRDRLSKQKMLINMTNSAETKFHSVLQVGNKRSFKC